jgi:glutamate N-acetyltransferase/amino-acid N-acetyltransferase
MSVTAARGFEAAGIACGIKPDGRPDMALVATADRRPVNAAGTFTTNLATAAPVQISREHLGDGRAAAVILNSGNANAATGERGRLDARRTCELSAGALGCGSSDVLVCATGLIGIPLPMDAIETGVPEAAANLGTTPDHGAAAADAILTTDTVRKETVVRIEVGGCPVTIGGMAKGAAMLAPSMATMLAVLTTDAAVEATALHIALLRAVNGSFNELIVDGAQSTNDSVFVLAGGAAGNTPLAEESRGFEAFTDALRGACGDLAAQMAADAEGATVRARIHVKGARSDHEARLAARGVASSQLVQCSLYGHDPYWGRVLAELGASGAQFDPERVGIAYGDIIVCQDGVAAEHDETALAHVLAQRDLDIVCDLEAGSGEAMVLTTDLTHAYVDENMGTS